MSLHATGRCLGEGKDGKQVRRLDLVNPMPKNQRRLNIAIPLEDDEIDAILSVLTDLRAGKESTVIAGGKL